MRHSLLCLFLASFGLTSDASAQVPPGDSVRFRAGGPTPTPFEIVDTSDSGASVPILNIPAAITGSSTGVLDPVIGDLWAAGNSLDGNGNPFVTTNAGIFEVDRATGTTQAIRTTLSSSCWAAALRS
jgi:hypothetical protein